MSATAGYQAVEIPKFGGPEVFRVVEKRRAELKPDEVRIAVRAAGVNFADVMMRMGAYPESPPLPFVPGYEVAGDIAEIGSQVRRLAVGDRVLAGTRFGGYTTELVLPAEQVWRAPSRLSYAEAAAVPVNFLTAWIALHEMARVRKGDRVLIHSAAGGVGVAAVQIARNAGANVVGLTGSPGKADAIRKLGASEVILNADWERGLDGPGYDIILDAIGGKSLKTSFAHLAPTGRVVNFGVSSMISGNRRSPLKAVRMLAQTPFFHPLKLMMQNKGVYGLNLLQLFADTRAQAEPGRDPSHVAIVTRALDAILAEFERGALQAIVGKAFPLAQAGEAQRYLQSRANIGKVILEN